MRSRPTPVRMAIVVCGVASSLACAGAGTSKTGIGRSRNVGIGLRGHGGIRQDATNGWSMATTTQLVLNGTACTSWRMPDKKNIDFRFPCGTIIFE